MFASRTLTASLLLAAFAAPGFAAEVEPVATITVADEAAPPHAYQPPVVIKRQRMTEDQFINGDVVKLLASNPRLAGRIGVETRGSVVDLSGRVTTPGMVRIALRDARMVEGVKEVRNNLYTQVGGSRF